MDTEIKVQKGIVGYLDILGYSNFLDNNEPEDAAKKVLSMLTELPKTGQDILIGLLKGINPRINFEEAFSYIKWLIFSDTILHLHSFIDIKNMEACAIQWRLSMANLIVLYHHLFDAGLPIRGCLTSGSFYIVQNCFAGRAIIKAYRETHLLDLSAIIINDESVKEIENLEKENKETIFKDFAVDYLVPLKGGDAKPKKVLLPISPIQPMEIQKDMRTYVADSFLMHKKQPNPGMMSKLVNTELFYRSMSLNYPALFK